MKNLVFYYAIFVGIGFQKFIPEIFVQTQGDQSITPNRDGQRTGTIRNFPNEVGEKMPVKRLIKDELNAGAGDFIEEGLMVHENS